MPYHVYFPHVHFNLVSEMFELPLPKCFPHTHARANSALFLYPWHDILIRHFGSTYICMHACMYVRRLVSGIWAAQSHQLLMYFCAPSLTPYIHKRPSYICVIYVFRYFKEQLPSIPVRYHICVCKRKSSECRCCLAMPLKNYIFIHYLCNLIYLKFLLNIIF